MAPLLPPEMLALVIKNAHPYDLVNIACTCHMMQDFCEELLSYHKKASMQWKGVNCIDDDNPALRSHKCRHLIDAFKLAATLGENNQLPCHIRYLNIPNTEERWENLLQLYGPNIREKLVQLVGPARFLGGLDIDEWHENLMKTHEPGPVIAMLLSKACSLRELSISPDALVNVYVRTHLRQSWLSTPKSLEADGLLGKLKELNITDGPPTCNFSFPVEFLLFFPSLRSAVVYDMDHCYEIGARAPASEIAVSASGKVLQDLEYLEIRASTEPNAILFLLEKAPRLESMSLFGIITTSVPDKGMYFKEHGATIWEDFLDPDGLLRRLKPQSLPIKRSLPRSLSNLRSLRLSLNTESLLEATPFSDFAPRSLKTLSIYFEPPYTAGAVALRQSFKGFNVDEWPCLGSIHLDEDVCLYWGELDQGHWSDKPPKQVIRQLVPLLESCGLPVCPVAYSQSVDRKTLQHLIQPAFEHGPPLIVSWSKFEFHVGRHLCASKQPNDDIEIRLLDSKKTRNLEVEKLREATIKAQAQAEDPVQAQKET